MKEIGRSELEKKHIFLVHPVIAYRITVYVCQWFNFSFFSLLIMKRTLTINTSFYFVHPNPETREKKYTERERRKERCRQRERERARFVVASISVLCLKKTDGRLYYTLSTQTTRPLKPFTARRGQCVGNSQGCSFPPRRPRHVYIYLSM